MRVLEGSISAACRGVIGVGSVSQLRAAQLGRAAHCEELGELPAACLQARHAFDAGLLPLDSSQIPLPMKNKIQGFL